MNPSITARTATCDDQAGGTGDIVRLMFELPDANAGVSKLCKVVVLGQWSQNSNDSNDGDSDAIVEEPCSLESQIQPNNNYDIALNQAL